MISLQERDRQILRMRKEGMSQREVARKFKLSPSRVYLIERRDKVDTSMAERRCALREEIRNADNLGKLLPVNDLVDAIGVFVVTKKRLLEHFRKIGKPQISLQELMNMCLNAPVEGRDFMIPPLYGVRGIGKIGFWSIVSGLTGMDLGSRCNQKWQKQLIKVKQEHAVTGVTPYPTPGS